MSDLNSVSRFLTKHKVTVLPHPPYSPDLCPCDFFLFPRLKKRLKGRRHENRGYSNGCDNEAHMHFKRGIHQLLSGLAETLATVYWLRVELLRRGQEALVVRLNFVFFTDSVSELYGQRMYILCLFVVCVNPERDVMRKNDPSIPSPWRPIRNVICLLQWCIIHTNDTRYELNKFILYQSL
jgi:hypothetical protein